MSSFSIVIPVYNEESILAASVRRLLKQLHKESLRCHEIILVENGSRDNTWSICQSLAQQYPTVRPIKLPHPHYGGSLKKGILAAKTNIVVLFNIDFWDVNFLKQGLELLKIADIVTGSKTLIASDDQRPFHRRTVSAAFNILLRLFFNFPGTDTHGIKVLRRDKILPHLHKCCTRRELFDTELLLRASKAKLILTELPVKVREIRPTRYNNLCRIINTTKDLIYIVKYKYAQLFRRR